jgi:ribosomal protein S18 acetylase RimI-like enzyme
MTHLLDDPVWSALGTSHAALAQGGAAAKRYPGSIVPFAATADDSDDALRALGELASPGETLFLLRAAPIITPPGFNTTIAAPGVQMIADAPLDSVADERISPLCQADAEEMLALATLTKPGPFSLRALDLGGFWGIKLNGRLAAMAGQRMRQPGFTELSGVCTHPDFRGEGLARLLSLYVADQIFARGEQPYLHAWATNTPAIALYEAIGFKLRAGIHVAAIERVG